MIWYFIIQVLLLRSLFLFVLFLLGLLLFSLLLLLIFGLFNQFLQLPFFCCQLQKLQDKRNVVMLSSDIFDLRTWNLKAKVMKISQYLIFFVFKVLFGDHEFVLLDLTGKLLKKRETFLPCWEIKWPDNVLIYLIWIDLFFLNWLNVKHQIWDLTDQKFIVFLLESFERFALGVKVFINTEFLDRKLLDFLFSLDF